VHDGGHGVLTMNATLVIPALNEAGAIGDLVRRVPAGAVREVIVVDNGSTDGTAAVAAAAGARVVREPRRGYGAACWAGLSAVSADTDVVVFFDGDGSQCPEELPEILGPIGAGRADLVLGARRRTRGHPAHATLGTRLIARLITWRHGARVTDIPPFRAIRIDLLRELDMRDRAFGWPVEMVAKAATRGARIVEVAVSHRPRAAGRSKVSGTVIGSLRAGYAFIVIALRTTRGAA
jgi:glycosyltransferase involved in cell wall biosynthesis